MRCGFTSSAPASIRTTPRSSPPIGRRLPASQWPAPVVALYAGAMSADQILSAAASADFDRKRREQTCEADFFVGFYQAGIGAAAEARPLLQAAAQDCPNDFLERPAATLELQRLGDAAPAQMKQVNP